VLLVLVDGRLTTDATCRGFAAALAPMGAPLRESLDRDQGK
jgi:hypothetical protein